MKKFLPILVVGILVVGGLGASALNINVKKENIINTEPAQNRATHTVFAEEGTATWCGYCKYAHGAMKELYAEGQLDFIYTTLVDDKNSKAAARCRSDYNLYGFPTVWWDGGYRVDVGASSVAQAKAAYTNSINICGSRIVKDINTELTVVWLGGTEMQIDCTITNNEGNTYDGRIRVYITEKVSSMGWYDSGGVLYTFPFLDWAFNEPVSIESGDSWSDSMTWDGSDYGYTTITPGNTMIIAAVFNSESHQGYSNPPSGNPFTAYYVDDTIAAEPITNHPPEKPTISGPTSGDPATNYAFTFKSTDYEQEDLYYWVDWGDGTDSGWQGPYNSGENAVINHVYNEVGIYKIKVKAKDINDLESVWSDLHQIIIGNFAPSAPTISGPTSGKIRTDIEYTFVATDPNNDDLLYTIKWGDGSSEDYFGPYTSGEEVKMSHSWNKEGTWYIEAKVKDQAGLESSWSKFVINVPRTKSLFDLLFTDILQRFPIIDKLVDILFNY